MTTKPLFTSALRPGLMLAATIVVQVDRARILELETENALLRRKLQYWQDKDKRQSLAHIYDDKECLRTIIRNGAIVTGRKGDVIEGEVRV